MSQLQFAAVMAMNTNSQLSSSILNNSIKHCNENEHITRNNNGNVIP
jgi:hypothetical protein